MTDEPNPASPDDGKVVRLCASGPDLLSALEAVLPFAVTAPAWVIREARAAIRLARKERL